MWRESDLLYQYRLPVYSIWKNRYPFIKHNQTYRRLMRELKSYSIDHIIVNTRFHLTSHIGARLGRQNNIPVSLIEHGSAPLTLDNPLFDKGLDMIESMLTSHIRKNVDLVFGVSQAAVDHADKRFRLKTGGIWYNSIDIDPNAAFPTKNSKRITISYVGRIIKQKGVDTLLASVTELSRTYDNIRVNIVGDGPCLEELKSTFKAPNIQFHGRLSQEEVRKIDLKTDIFVYAPNHPEGLPSAILEAGLAGCAVIGSPQGGIKEIIVDKKNGLIVNGTVKDLVAKLKTLIDNPKLRVELAKRLYDDIANKFSTKKVVDRILADLKIE